MGIHNNNWKDFFFDPNEGLGTLYDRMILEGFFQRLIDNYNVRTALDCPSFGMTGFSGINSLYLAKNGVEVTVCDDNPERLEWAEALWSKIGLSANFYLVTEYSSLPFDNQSFDLTWNLSALWYLRSDDISSVIQELERVTCKCLFLSVHNKEQLFYPIWKKVEPEFSEHVKDEYSDKKVLEGIYKQTLEAFSLMEDGYFVTTPWPGVILKKEQLLRRNKHQNGSSNSCSHDHRLEDIKMPVYVEQMLHQNPDSRIQKLMAMEKLPNFVKRRWAHLAYWIFVRNLVVLPDEDTMKTRDSESVTTCA